MKKLNLIHFYVSIDIFFEIVRTKNVILSAGEIPIIFFRHAQYIKPSRPRTRQSQTRIPSHPSRTQYIAQTLQRLMGYRSVLIYLLLERLSKISKHLKTLLLVTTHYISQQCSAQLICSLTHLDQKGKILGCSWNILQCFSLALHYHTKWVY